MTLFALAKSECKIIQKVLNKFFHGEKDQRTIDISQDKQSGTMWQTKNRMIPGAEAPDGWTKWTIPGYEYIVVENQNGVFEEILGQMKEEGIPLAWAVHDFTDPAIGKNYMYFPIRKVQ